MGDPDAVVVDRHHVRLAEAPERNIFASVKEARSAPAATTTP